MLQLGPALAGMQCILKLLKVVTALTKISPTSLGDIISAAADFVEHCVPLPIAFACTILDIIRLLIKYLKCIISAILSILEFQVGIDLNAVQDNPVVLLSLQCAQGNADASMTSLKDALAIIDSLLTLIQPVLTAAEDALPDKVKQGLQTISEIKSTLDSIVGAGGVSAGVPGVQDTIQTLQGFQDDLQQLDATLTTVAEMLGCN